MADMAEQRFHQKEVNSLVNEEPLYQTLFSNWLMVFTDFFMIKPETLDDAGVQLEQAPEQERN
jgi:hypothetical protein